MTAGGQESPREDSAVSIDEHWNRDPVALGSRDAAEETSPEILVSRSMVDAGTRFDAHLHQEDQLAWMASGSMELALLGDRWHLRREHLAWIPAGTLHEMSFGEPGELISVYVDPVRRPPGGRWNGSRTVRVDELAGALLLHLVDADPPTARRRKAWALLTDLISDATRHDEALALPRDRRARTVASALMANPADARELGAWAAQVGVSAKTIARAFASDTGCTFREWRVRVRLHAAAGMLAQGEAVQDVASAVGYDSVSSFIGAFRARFSMTPAVYRSRTALVAGGKS
jgi:AraC-like DNA-binding protein/quercetin dioxygenase-like cupin family protein